MGNRGGWIGSRLKELWALPIALLIVAAMPAAGASAAVISFDNLTAPGPGGHGLPVTTQYSGQGVTFNSPEAFDYSKGSFAIPGFAHSGNVAVEPCVAIEFCISTVRADLASAHRYARVWVGFSSPLSAPLGVRLTAFSGSSAIVGTANATLPARSTPTPINTPLAINLASATIRRLEVSVTTGGGYANGLAVDDVEFSPNSPPPPPAPDFTLTPATTSVAVEQGQSVSDAITITRLRGSTGNISFSAAGLPDGVGAAFNPNPAPGTQSLLTLTAAATAPPTGKSVTVTGTPQSPSAGPAPRGFTLQVNVRPGCRHVSTAAELVAALAAGYKCIYVEDNAVIDLAEDLDGVAVPGETPECENGTAPQTECLTNAESVLIIPDGVTLMSGRSPTVEGGILEMSHRMPAPDPNDEGVYKKVMLNLGSDTRVIGLRLRGYNPRDRKYRGDATRAIFINGSQRVLIENNEISAWPHSAVYVANSPAQNELTPRITRNFIHNQVQCSEGQGVLFSTDGFARIDRNLFNYNRHDVGSTDGSFRGYFADLNFSLTSGPKCDPGDVFQHYNQHYDAHGSNGGYGGRAGDHIAIFDNTIRGAQGYAGGFKHRPAFWLRGTPQYRAVFSGNAVHNRRRFGGKGAVRVDDRDDLDEDDLLDSGKLAVGGNDLCVDTAHQLAVGDFNGDGRDDVFQSVGTLWAYSPSGQREWHFLNDSRIRLGRLGLGDFDGDGKTDVFFRSDDDDWLVSYGGTSDLTPLPAGSGIDIKRYRFGDFDGDGKTDVFRANGSHFVISSGGATEWQELVPSRLKLDRLRFGDFNGDGATDVFSLANDQWSVSYGGSSGWTRLNRKLSSNLDNLAFADFNGDRLTDIARNRGNKWQVSWGGLTNWRTLQAGRDESLSEGMLFGDFNGEPGADVLRHGAPLPVPLPAAPCWMRRDFLSFSRYRLSAGGTRPFAEWSSADMR